MSDQVIIRIGANDAGVNAVVTFFVNMGVRALLNAILGSAITGASAAAISGRKLTVE